MASSPEEVFSEAQAAMAAGDFAGFFRCLDRKDQLQLGANEMAGLLRQDPPVVNLFGELQAKYGIPSAAVEEVRSLTRHVMESAQRFHVLQAEAKDSASSEHRLLVKRMQQGVKKLLESIPELPAFLGDAEVASRRLFGGGSVSTTLFVGETLEEVAVEGDRAWGMRVGRTSNGARWSEDVGFVRDRSSVWRIRLNAKRSRGRSRRSGDAVD